MPTYEDTKDIYLTEYFENQTHKKHLKRVKSSKKELKKKQDNVIFFMKLKAKKDESKAKSNELKDDKEASKSPRVPVKLEEIYLGPKDKAKENETAKASPKPSPQRTNKSSQQSAAKGNNSVSSDEFKKLLEKYKQNNSGDT
eukprot:TRINITY_DN3879_c0_g1_i1.p1 TRINITY_DN3879_c0_g1~~TRINITY_DN3879_c0_g1_i1.p1  ORF type:complete len:142 (-),score=48.30 TRINITY_DN3879_c0_g1_i1:125-550(-)